MEGLDFGGIWLHAFGSKHCAMESNLRLPDSTLSTVEDDVMVMGCLHKLQELLVMLLWGMAIDAYIMMNDDCAR